MVTRIVAGVGDGHHDETQPGQSGGEIMQGQRTPRIAVGQHQQRKTALGNGRAAGHSHWEPVYVRSRRALGRGVEHLRAQRMPVHRVAE